MSDSETLTVTREKASLDLPWKVIVVESLCNSSRVTANSRTTCWTNDSTKAGWGLPNKALAGR